MSKKSEIREAEKEIDLNRLYSIKLVNSAQSSHFIVRWLYGIVIFFILSMFIPWQQNIDGAGIVTALNPQERPQTIQTLIAGKIDKWHVQEGQFVKKGDTILTITEIKDKYLDPQLVSRLDNQIKSKESSIKSKYDKVNALGDQLKALKKQLSFSISKAINKVEQAKMYVMIDSVELIAAQADNDIASIQFERQKKLFDQGLVSLTNLEQRKLKFQQSNAKFAAALNKFNATKNGQQGAEIELNSLQAEYADKFAKNESDQSATQSEAFDAEASLFKQRTELSNMELRNNLYVIRAPQDGYVVKAKKQGLGETVKEGEAIISIMPNNPHLAVELYIKPIDLPLVYIGCPVRVQFDGWPAIVFAGWPGASVGTFGGKVKVIDYINSSNGKFRVLVVPDETGTPWPKQLRLGSGALGWSMLNTVLLGYEIWRQFNGFPPDFISNVKGDKNSNHKNSNHKKSDYKEKQVSEDED